MTSPPVVSPVNHEQVSSLLADAGDGRTRSPGSRSSMPENTVLRVIWEAMEPQSAGSENSGPAGSSVGVADSLGRGALARRVVLGRRRLAAGQSQGRDGERDDEQGDARTGHE